MAAVTPMLYVWAMYPHIYDMPFCRAQLWYMCDQLGVTDVFCAVTDYYPMGTHEAAWSNFISEANSHSINVWAEIGYSYPSMSYAAILSASETLVSQVIQFNQENPTTTFFGFGLDIEGSPMSTRYDWLHDTYLPALKAVSYGGEVLADQGLLISLYDDSLILAGFVSQLQWDTLMTDVDRIEIQAYPDSEVPVGNAAIAQQIIDKADGGGGFGASRVDSAEALNKDYYILQELNRYTPYSSNHRLSWMDQSDVQAVLDLVHAEFDAGPHYLGIALHDSTGLTLRQILKSMAVDGTNLTLEILRIGKGSAVDEEISITSPGMTTQTFTPAINTLYTKTFTDYVSPNNVTITATRTLSGHGPCDVMVFLPSGGVPPEPPAESGYTMHMVTPVDVTPGAADAWQTIDLDDSVADLGADVTGVILRVRGDQGGVNFEEFGCRALGSADARLETIRDAVFTAMCGVDADHKFQVYLGSIATCAVWITGYTTTGIEFLATGEAKACTADSAWHDIDCSVEAPLAAGLIFEVTSSDYYDYGLKHADSTDDRHQTIGYHSFFITGCSSAQVCKGWKSNAGVTFTLVGYIVDGVDMHINGIDRSLTATGVWTDITLSTNAVAGIFEVHSTTDGWYGLRNNGCVADATIRGTASNQHCLSIVQCDASYICEGRISEIAVDFWELGIAVAEPTEEEEEEAGLGSAYGDPWAAGAHYTCPTIDYEYGPIHTIYNSSTGSPVFRPNKVTVYAKNYSGDYTSPWATLLDQTYPSQIDARLTDWTVAQCELVAEASVKQAQNYQPGGHVLVPVNIAQEIYDYVKVTDQRSLQIGKGRVCRLVTKWAASKKFGEPSTFTSAIDLGGMAYNRSPIQNVPVDDPNKPIDLDQQKSLFQQWRALLGSYSYSPDVINRLDGNNWFTTFDSIDGLTITFAGAGSATLENGYLKMLTPAVDGGRVTIWKSILGKYMDFNKRIRAMYKFYIAQDTAQIISMWTGGNSGGLGLEITDDTIKGRCMQNGMVEEITLGNVIPNTWMTAEILSLPGSACHFYLNKAHEGLITTCLPRDKQGYIPIMVNLRAQAAAVKEARIAEWYYIEDP